jgi:hypothetical protein
MAVTLSCATVRDGLPESCKKGSPLRAMAGFYTVSKGTVFTETEAAALTNYTSKVIAKTLLPVHKIFSIEDVSIEKKVQESNYGRKKTTHPGYRGYKCMFDYKLDNYKTMANWMDTEFDIIPYDNDGNIIFVSAGGDNLKGFSIDYFDVEKQPVITDANAQMTVIEIQETDINEWKLARHLNPYENTAVADRWAPTDVKTITTVTLTAGAVASDKFTVNVDFISSSEMKDGTDVSTGVTGAAAANFTVLDGSGNTVTPDTVTEQSTAGEYEIDCTGTGYTGGTVQFIPVASDEKLFKSAVVTVS